MPLDPRRRAVVSAVRAFTWAHGHPPSFPEIADMAGLPDETRAYWQVVRLASDGFLTHHPNRPRTVRLGPRVAFSRSGLLAEAVPVARCAPCGMDVPADHECPRAEAATAPADPVTASTSAKYTPYSTPREG